MLMQKIHMTPFINFLTCTPPLINARYLYETNPVKIISDVSAMAPVDSRRFGGPEDSVDYRVYMPQSHTPLDPDKRR
jgi:hypothetical protein